MRALQFHNVILIPLWKGCLYRDNTAKQNFNKPIIKTKGLKLFYKRSTHFL